MHRSASFFVTAFVIALIGVASPVRGANDAASPLTHGVVKGLDSEAGTVTLDHDEIPGVMMAMTMTYPVEKPTVLKDVAVGQRVDFRLRKDGDRFVVTEIQGATHAGGRSGGMSCCDSCDGMDCGEDGTRHEMSGRHHDM